MQQGVQRGRAEGFHEAAHEIAKRIFKTIQDPAVVADMTGLSQTEVAKLLRTHHS